MRFENLHSDTVAEIMRLQHRVADEAPISFAEPPDILTGDGPTNLALALLPPRGPEERRIGCDGTGQRGKMLVHVGVEELRDGVGEGNVACLAALDADVAESPLGIQIANPSVATDSRRIPV